MDLSKLTDPIWTVTGIIYVFGVIFVILSATDLVHGFLEKDKSPLKRGLLLLLIGISFLLPHFIYVRI